MSSATKTCLCWLACAAGALCSGNCRAQAATTDPVVIVLPLPPPAEGSAEAGSSPTPLHPGRLEQSWERLQLRLGGYMLLDWGSVHQSNGIEESAGNPRGGLELRDLQLDIRGVVYNKTDFRVQLSWDDGRFELQDNYLSRDDVPYLGTVRLGHFKEPFGLEHTSRSQYAPFLERSIVDALTPSRGLGLAFSNTAFNERVTWAAGMFYGTTSADKISERESTSLTGRVTGIPLYNAETHQTLHIGASFSHRDTRKPLHYKVRPEVDQAPRYLDTGDFSSAALDVLGLEAAYQHGPWLAQAEAVRTVTSDAVRAEEVTLNAIADELYNRAPRFADWLTGKTGWQRPADSLLWSIPFDLQARGELQFFGVYGQLSYILTGEKRAYDTARGLFGPVIPETPVHFGRGGGWGAWEIAARVSHLDLNDDYVNGGRQTNVSLACNWYLTRAWRVGLNYVHSAASRDVYDGDMDALVFRVQLDVQPKPLQRQAPTNAAQRALEQ